MSLHVLHVFKLYLPDLHGGIQEVIRQLCHATSRQYGVENRVLTVAQGPGEREMQLPDSLVVRCRLTLDLASTPMSADMVGEFRRQLRWADVVHYHFPWPFGECLHLLFGRKTQSVVTYHSDIFKQRLLKIFYGPLLHAFLGRVGRIVATSPNYLESSVDLAPHRRLCEVIPIGLDERSYAQPSTATLARWTEAVGSGFFLFIGILRYYKGLDVLLAAAQDAPFRVVVAGTGPLEKDLRRQAAQRNLANVTFVGYVGDEDKAALFALARAVVLPSLYRSEAFGVSLLEGAMSGLPLIATELGTGTSYVNQGEVTGLVVPPGDAGALRRAMERLHADDALSATMGAAARRRFETLFTADRMGADYFRLYRELAESGGGRSSS
ncbi:MAG TPA: glycosyl transferase family 1 [Desulfobulbaceae bacterium]|nr:glycosyl transferase family 1 [Desulfobulbaceae bacterium]